MHQVIEDLKITMLLTIINFHRLCNPEKNESEGSPETENVNLRSVDSIAVISSNMYVNA